MALLRRVLPRFLGLRSAPQPRAFSTPSKVDLMKKRLEEGLDTKVVHVEDTSGGCGSFFRIFVASPKFEGQSLVEQHRLVNQLLSADIKEMHGLTLRTKTLSAFEREQASKSN
eukprot:TRINITY_DN9243_c0_g2_i1.p1 TRINITY_DN9243_c0_g2~~TRINITY_DN9243_c0_g2_i1.p1  ORF type:complete len:127 (+),score=8.47 TRINITY_DN9243_c0_g2_i1:45-383(+)